MDWFLDLSPQTQAALISATVSALVALVLAALNPITQRWLERTKSELQRDLEIHRNGLLHELEERKLALQGTITREVQLQLGERAAQRTYEYEARKRLYLAIGPLRLQLLFSCRECERRVEQLMNAENYNLSMSHGYYGLNTLYRLLRPLAVLELIERQLAHADFAIDQGALDCLRLKSATKRIWAGDEVVLEHPAMDWSKQVQHVFAGSITQAANTLICNGQESAGRIMRFDEFNAAADAVLLNQISPFPKLMANFSPLERPVLWVRLVAYGHACTEFINRDGTSLGFARKEYPVAELIAVCRDPYILSHLKDYVDAAKESVLGEL